jgi:hypothetical protein
MADPLSVTASALTVIEVSSACAKILLQIIQSHRAAPAQLVALSNEVNDIKTVLDDIKTVCQSIEQEPSPSQGFLDMTSKQLAEAREILVELDGLLKRFMPLNSSRRWRWPLNKGKAERLLQKLKEVRSNLLAQLALPAA